MPASSREQRWATPSTSTQVVAALHRRHDGERLPAERQPALAPTESLDLDGDHDPVQLDVVPRCAESADPEPVRLAGETQLDLAADRGVEVRPPPARRTEERGPVDRSEQLVRVERGSHQRDVPVERRQVAARRGQAVQP